MHQRLARLAALVALSVLGTRTMMAQDAESSTPSGLGPGLKAGVGNDPAQVVIGAQWGFHFRRIPLLRIVPNVQFGFGDETTTDFNADVLLRAPVGKGFAIYGGGTPTVTIGSGGESDMGGTWLIGAQLPVITNRATTIEARFGSGGAPKFRLMAAIIF